MSETYKISDEKIAENGMSSVETRPNAIGIGPSGHIGATGLKEKMDALPKLIAAKHNKLVDALGIEEEEPGADTLAGKVEKAVSLASSSASDAENAASAAKASKEEAEKAASAAKASKEEAEKAASDAKDAKEDAEVSKNRAVTAEQNAVLLKTQVDNALPALDKRLNNIESYFSPDPFLELSAADGKIAIPANALPWASIDEVGGMTYRKPKTLGSFEPDAYASLRYYLRPGVEPPAHFTIPLRNTTGSEMVVQANFNASVYRQEITLLADGTFHEYTVAVPEGVEYLDAVTSLEILDENYAVPAGIEAGTLTVYQSGGEYVLEHSPVSEVQSLDAEGAVLSSVTLPEEVQSLSEYGCGITGTGSGRVVTNRIIWNPDEGIKEYRKKVVRIELTGNETIYPDSNYPSVFRIGQIVVKKVAQLGLGICSEYTWKLYTTPVDLQVGEFAIGYGEGGFTINTGYSSVDEWKTYLKERYNAGNPVVFFLEAASEETTDISNILPDDNLIEVVPGGSLRFVTGTGNAPTAKATIMKKEGT